MNKILILGLILSMNVFAESPDFDSTTSVVSFPEVTVDKESSYTDVKLLLSPDNSWKVLRATPKIKSSNPLSMTGYWSSTNASGFLCASSFATPWADTLNLLIVQKEEQLSGFEVYIFSMQTPALRLFGEVVGTVKGNSVNFNIVYQGQVRAVYSGTISADYKVLTFSSDAVCGEGEGREDLIFRWQQ
ncbi:MAG: hypothetical protein GQ582_01395 [Methyloprofundus sp.]|nr:hypothetical protein [Methyloprofundus sp.]